MTGRRGFLAAMLGAAAAAVVDPDWVPGRKLISIPRPISKNRILTIQEITNEMLQVFCRNMDQAVLAGYESHATQVGHVLNIRKPFHTPNVGRSRFS